MLERSLLALTATLLLLATCWGVLRWQRRAQRRLQSPVLAAFWQEVGVKEGPAIVAFSTPECAQCRLLQKPALGELRRLVPDVPIVQVDAAAYPHVASAFGVFTVPTTVVLDERLRPVATNNGYVPAGRLHRQLGRLRQA